MALATVAAFLGPSAPSKCVVTVPSQPSLCGCVGPSSDDVGQKTKAIVTTSMRKVKDGTSQGFQWIKDKCQRNGGGKKQQDSEAPRYC
uniref:Uncharacterized protein n=1 Tax=Zea mays TaxID=4577 RepID=A0A804ULD0_MAIZE